MRAVVQRVTDAKVSVDGDVKGSIGAGMCVLLGVETGDGDKELEDYMLENGQSVQVFLSRKGYSCNRRTGHWDDKPQWVAASDLYGDYLSFCGKWLIDPVAQRAFGGEMTRLGWNTVGGNRRRTATGYIYGLFCENKIDYALKL